jgi:hypothetical protein
LAEKDSKPSLAALNNNLPTAIWRLWVQITAFAIHLHEQFFDLHRLAVEEIASRAIPGTPHWYQYMATQYQNGYTLSWHQDSLSYRYSVIDEQAKIVKLAAVRENNTGGVIIKVAKAGTANPQPLTNAEKAAFYAYMSEIKFAGTFLSVVSENPDEIQIHAEIYYDGTQLLGTIQGAVTQAIENYLATLPFDGVFQRSKLVDAIQALSDIEDVKLTTVAARFGAAAYQAIDLDYYAYSGYLRMATAFPLATTLQYIPR